MSDNQNNDKNAITEKEFTELNAASQEEMNTKTAPNAADQVMPTEEEFSKLQKEAREAIRKEAFKKIVIACLGGPEEKPIKKMMQEVNKNEYDAERMSRETPGFIFQIFFTVEAFLNTGETAKVCEVSALPFRAAAPILKGSDIDDFIAQYRKEFLEIYAENRTEINKKLAVLAIADVTEENVTISIESVSRFVKNDQLSGKPNTNLKGKQERQDIAKSFQQLADFFASQDQ